MQKNFTHFITAVNRSRNHRAILAALLLFMLLLVAKSASAQNPTTPTLSSASICVGGNVTLQSTHDGSGPGNSQRATSVVWQHSLTGAVNGPWTDITPTAAIPGQISNTDFNSSNKQVTSTLKLDPIIYQHRGYYRVRFYKDNGTSLLRTSANSSFLTVYDLPTAGNDQTKCAAGSTTEFTLFGSTPFGTLSWSVISGNATIDNPASATPKITVTGTGSATIRLTSIGNTGNPCGTKTDDVVLTVNPLPSANAGTDQDDLGNCTSGPTTDFTLAGNASNGTYSWSVFSNPNNVNVTIANPNQLNSNVTITGTGTVILRLTTTSNQNPVCTTATDDVVLTVNKIINEAPSVITPNNLEYFKPATFKAETTNPSVNWTYRWFIVYTNAGPPELQQETGATLTIPAEKLNKDFVEVQVNQVAPNDGNCYSSLFSSLAESNNTAPLPVELIYLKADKKNDNVIALEWATASEKNSEGFEVQISQDAQNYRTLAFVASKAGGNTNQKQVYTFYDKENGKYGTRYYRLMQRDINGDAEYFGPKAVQIGDAIEGLSAFPNAFTSEVNLEVNTEEAGTMHILVTNTTGATVLERTVKVAKGNNRELLQFNNGLPKGLYFVTTRLNGKTNHIKLLKR